MLAEQRPSVRCGGTAMQAHCLYRGPIFLILHPQINFLGLNNAEFGICLKYKCVKLGGARAISASRDWKHGMGAGSWSSEWM